MNKSPLVSIICTAYNHEDYIKDALDGFVMQKTNFPFEIIVSDDASTDETALIINQYEKKYPELFKIYYHKENQYSKGIPFFANELIANARGKYIALCEGDDYWTDPYKLQKQVDYLENNKNFVFCIHKYKRHFCNQNFYADTLYPELFSDNNGFIVNKLIFSKYWLTQPLTALICSDSLRNVFLLAKSFKYFRDIHIFYLLLQKGNGFCMNFYGGVYNIHDGGIHSGVSTKNQIIDNYNSIKELYLYDYDSALEPMLLNHIISMIKPMNSIYPLFLVFKLNVSLLKKNCLFLKMIKILAKRIMINLKKKAKPNYNL